MADSPEDFMQSPEVVHQVNNLIAIAKTRPLIWREIRVVLAYLASHIIFLNGQRPGVVQKMTIEEWESKELEGDHWVIDVMDHKTSGAFGPANVAVSTKIADLMEGYYANIRSNIIPQNSVYVKRFFLTNTGNEFTKISERMREVAESFGLSVPNSGVQRKVVATEAFKSENNIVVRNIQKHMCHSATTCEKFYQCRDHQLAIESKKAIENLTKSRHFKVEESKFILKEYPLTEETTPSLALCAKICEKYNLEKSKKQVQDHWRSCKKLHNQQ